MNKFFPLLLLVSGLISACADRGEYFVIKGTTSQDRLNGEQVFLVPYGSKQIEDSIGVDSVYIKDNKFEFRFNKGEYLARVTIDKKVRYGTQDLLVVTETGGVINVVIDSVSHGGGTPQNEALEMWKNKLSEHNEVLANQVAHRNYLRQAGDTIWANALTDSIKAFNESFREEMRVVARVLGRGPAYDLLIQRYGE